MDMMDNAKRVAHMPTATIVEAGIGFKVGLKLPTRVHDEAKKRNSTVVKKPLAKFRVPVNRFVRRVEPRAEAVAFCGAPVPPKSSTCCKNRCNVLMGSRMKLSRSCSRGMPSGSLAA